MYTLPANTVAGSHPVLGEFFASNANDVIEWVSNLNELNGTRFFNRRYSSFVCQTHLCKCRLEIEVDYLSTATVMEKETHNSVNCEKSGGQEYFPLLTQLMEATPKFEETGMLDFYLVYRSQSGSGNEYRLYNATEETEAAAEHGLFVQNRTSCRG